MRRHLNTLFVTLEGARLKISGAAVEVRHDGEMMLRIPLHNLDGVVCFGWDTTVSARLMHACAEAGVALSFHNPYGKFLVATNGFTSGNILLRRTQYRVADDLWASVSIARNIVSAKIANSRSALLRGVRDHGARDDYRSAALVSAADQLGSRIRSLSSTSELDEIRGVEGEAASIYFSVFNHLLTVDDGALRLNGRSRRPPLDPVNALLSFLYSLLMHDCRSALESCGLDSQCGFLHRDRPGRPSLALDLMEEFRTFFADRAALTLFNRRQITVRDFEKRESGAVLLREESRKTVLTHWQERKQEEIKHPFLDEVTTVGLLPHLQARLLARHLRGDLDAYAAFLVKG